ncbi:MAG: 4-hydroxy-3-methylbut-2-enyl diphosphate reductase [Negativicutes bacterium]|nr:4-hydroxy-3-methylbut-2-enyl diphosphate reductase [Negativicutes bacterium]
MAMEIIKAEFMGFCYGVKRAIELVERLIAGQEKDVYTYGPIIHNPQQVEKFRRLGVEARELLPDRGTVVVRSHGAGPDFYRQAAERGIRVVDGTCPDVKRVQSIAAEAAAAGNRLVVIGDRNHPEVQAVVEWAGGQAEVIGGRAQADSWRPQTDDNVVIVAQTTFEQVDYCDIIGVLRQKRSLCRGWVEHQTICSSSQKRQQAARRLALTVDAMVVVGGRNSANTVHLAAICREACPRVYHVEVAHDLDCAWLAGVKRCGLTAGASTPQWLVDEVYDKLLQCEGEVK